MFRILLFSAFGLLLAAVGKFLFMDDYLPPEARRVAVSAALPSGSGLADEQRRSAGLFVSAQSGAEVDSLFEDVLPAEGAAANLGGGGRAIARDLLGGGVVEPEGPAALPSASDGVIAEHAATGEPAGEKASETASEPQAHEIVTAAALPSLPPGVARQPAMTPSPDPAADEGAAPTPPAMVDEPADRPADARRSEGKSRVVATAAVTTPSAAARKRSKDGGREERVVEKRPAPAATARSQAPKQVAKVERSKAVVARSTATAAPGHERRTAARAATAQSAKAAGTYQARVRLPADGRVDRKLLARLEQEKRGAPARAKNEPTNSTNTATGGGMARSISGVNGDEMVSRWVGSVATGVQRLMGHELNSVSKPRSVVGYCRSQPDSWIYDEGRKQMVYCGEVAAARGSARP